MKKNYFELKDGTALPAGERFLNPFLSPTSKGTDLRSSPPSGEMTDRQKGRVLLQVHQIISLFNEFGITFKDKKLHDIGTGNGLIPRLLLELTDLQEAVGSDPFLDSEHPTSWQRHDRDQALSQMCDLIDETCGTNLDYNSYAHLLDYESHSMIPRPANIVGKSESSYRFIQTSVHDLPQKNETFDIFYCKAIEHISDWPGFFAAVDDCSGSNTVIYLKHRSFYSYSGPHRYGTLDIPWGHLLLSDDEYRSCVQERFPEVAEKMMDFYFNDLTYPRNTVPDMVRIAGNMGFLPVAVITEPFRELQNVVPFIEEVPDFWERVRSNHPTVGADEVFSGMHHILLKRGK